MRKPLIVLFAVLLLGLLGCEQQSTAPNQSVPDQLLSSDIPPEVDNLLKQYDDLGVISDRSLAGTESVFPDPNDPDWDVYAMVFLWGHLTDPTVVADIAPVDWSGTITANAEVMINPFLTIDFEPGEDSLYITNAVHFVHWTSFAGHDIDGLAMLVYLKRGNVYITPPVLTYETAPITVDLPFHQLDHFAAYYPVTNTGQGLAVLSRRIWHGDCPSGLMQGRWIPDVNTADQGTFEGLWLDNNNEPSGRYNGHYWTTSDGERRFSGWVSGYVTDQIIAEFEGYWWFDDLSLCPTCGDGHGWYYGRVRFADDDRGGVMKGEFGDRVNAYDAAALPMRGVWKTICYDADVSTNSIGSQ